MAVSQDKIKERLKALFPKANLSKQRLDAIAAKLAPKPEDDATDDQVDEIINDYNDVMDFEQIARDDDRIRTLEAARKQKPATKSEEDPKIDDDTPAWAKALQQEIASLKAERAKETIVQRFNSDPRVKDIPEFIRKGYIPQNEDDFEAKVIELSNEYKGFAEKNKIQAYPNDVPANGTPDRKTGTVKKISADDAKKIIESI